jgi:signal transduction histidine kinase
VSVAAVAIGACFVVRSTGLWLGDPIMVPFGIVVSGIVVLGVLRPSSIHRPGLAAPVAVLVAGRHARGRVIAGAALVSLGLVMVGTGGGVSGNVRAGVFATAVTILGVGVLLGPWMARVAQQAAEERRERIRSQEREAMAAHLHDSVLQTLTLIQRGADDPRRTITLARKQERELRAWLYGTRGTPAESLAAAVRAIAAEVEAAYHVRVEVVVVGDREMGDELSAFVAAIREGCINAAKHSGEAEKTVYVEADDTSVEAFVRDRGCGFDRGLASPDRRGIAQSIEARLVRIGGTATIDSAPGEGTEVHLVLPTAIGENGRDA